MSTAKRYRITEHRFVVGEDYEDSEGNPCTLEKLCRDEPDWAANRLRVGLKRIAELETAIRQHELERISDYEADITVADERLWKVRKDG